MKSTSRLLGRLQTELGLWTWRDEGRGIHFEPNRDCYRPKVVNHSLEFDTTFNVSVPWRLNPTGRKGCLRRVRQVDIYVSGYCEIAAPMSNPTGDEPRYLIARSTQLFSPLAAPFAASLQPHAASRVPSRSGDPVPAALSRATPVRLAANSRELFRSRANWFEVRFRPPLFPFLVSVFAHVQALLRLHHRRWVRPERFPGMFLTGFSLCLTCTTWHHRSAVVLLGAT